MNAGGMRMGEDSESGVRCLQVTGAGGGPKDGRGDR